MGNIKRIFSWALLVLLSSSCNDDHELRPIDSLGAKLVAYDEAASERTRFDAQTNISFGLSLTNKGDVDINAGSYFDYCSVYEQEDFLLIYKLVRQENGEENWIPYGKPYQEPAFCPTILIPVIVPINGEVRILGGTWSSVPHNPPFTPGKYYTSYSFDLALDGKSRRHQLKLEFEVL